MTNLLFAYGSLKADYALHYVIAGSTFLGNYKTAPDFKLMSLGAFPALVVAPAGVEVSGEVYRVDDDILAYLDIVEGVNRGLYTRERIVVHDQLGDTLEVWAYIASRFHRFTGIEIPDGVWTQ